MRTRFFPEWRASIRFPPPISLPERPARACNLPPPPPPMDCRRRRTNVERIRERTMNERTAWTAATATARCRQSSSVVAVVAARIVYTRPPAPLSSPFFSDSSRYFRPIPPAGSAGAGRRVLRPPRGGRKFGWGVPIRARTSSDTFDSDSADGGDGDDGDDDDVVVLVLLAPVALSLLFFLTHTLSLCAPFSLWRRRRQRRRPWTSLRFR